MEEYHKDLLVLVLVGLLAIEIGGLLLGLLAALMSAGGIGYLARPGPVLEAIGQFFTENPPSPGARHARRPCLHRAHALLRGGQVQPQTWPLLA